MWWEKYYSECYKAQRMKRRGMKLPAGGQLTDVNKLLMYLQNTAKKNTAVNHRLDWKCKCHSFYTNPINGGYTIMVKETTEAHPEQVHQLEMLLVTNNIEP